MNCIYKDCPKYPEFRCHCTNITKMICYFHLPEHIRDTSSDHHPYKLSLASEEITKSLVIEALMEAKKKSQSGLKTLISSFADLQNHLGKIFSAAFQELKNFSNEIEGLKNMIINTPDSLPDSNIKKTLSLTSELAKYECENWKLIIINPIIDNIYKLLSELKLVNIDMSYLYDSNKNTNYDEFYSKTIDLKSSFNPSIYPMRQSCLAERSPVYIPPKKLLCSKNHECIWSPFAPFYIYNQTKSFSIQCNLCNNCFSKSCWQCLICKTYICENCSYKKGIACPKLVCKKNHELKYRSDINSYYKNKGLGHGYTCKNCLLRKLDSHWHCRECDYDICTECGSNSGFRPLKKSITCNNGHSLKLEVIEDIEFQTIQSCNSCKCPGFGLIYSCNQCCYLICEECFKIQNGPMAYHPSVMCFSSHFLNWAEKITYNCRYCFKSINEGYICKQCAFGMCGECAMIITELFIKDTLKTHGKASHPMLWVEKPWIKFSMNDFVCRICCATFSKAGIFACIKCEFFLCLRCNNESSQKTG